MECIPCWPETQEEGGESQADGLWEIWSDGATKEEVINGEEIGCKEVVKW